MSIVIRTFERNSDRLFIMKYFGKFIPFLPLDRLTLLFHIFSSISTSPYTRLLLVVSSIVVFWRFEFSMNEMKIEVKIIQIFVVCHKVEMNIR